MAWLSPSLKGLSSLIQRWFPHKVSTKLGLGNPRTKPPQSNPNKPKSADGTYDHMVLSSNDPEWLLSICRPSPQETFYSIIKDAEHADMIFTVEGEVVYIDHRLPMVSQHLGTRLPSTVAKGDTKRLQQIIQSATRFRYYLTATNLNVSSVDVHMRLNELRIQWEGRELITAGPDILQNEPASVIVDDTKRYGATIENLTGQLLYPHLFYFDPLTLSIFEWYHPQIHPGSHLPAHSSLCIGHGSGTASPFKFVLRPGQTKDVGFFKLFLTTSSASLSAIVQASPLDGLPGPDIQVSFDILPSAEFWATKCATVVQCKN